MKAIYKRIFGALIIALTLTATVDAFAADKKVCKVSTNDIGTIVGRGPSSDSAFEDAATQCFERRAKLYEMKKGTSLDEDTGLVMIDMCANIKCS